MGNAAKIAQHSRQDALLQGALVDVTRQARGFGFKVPVAISANAYAALSTHVSDEFAVLRSACVLDAAARAARRALAQTEHVGCNVRCGGEHTAVIPMQVCVGPGDGCEAVVTIMLASEHERACI